MKHFLFAAAACAATLSAPAFAADPSFAGFWKLEGDFSTLKTIDGKIPPMTPEARKRYNASVALRKQGKPVPTDTVQKCWPHGLPRLLLAPYPIEVLQDAKQITFLHEAHHMPRLVYLGEKLPALDTLDNNYMGFSVGNWDKETLVIDTAGFNDITTLDKAGIPHSEALVLQERLQRRVQRRHELGRARQVAVRRVGIDGRSLKGPALQRGAHSRLPRHARGAREKGLGGGGHGARRPNL
jgi:hypothetical protein